MSPRNDQDLGLLRFTLFDKEVIQAISTRRGGVSRGPFASLNLGAQVGDDPALVQRNRRTFLKSLGIELRSTVALSQVHGSKVVLAGREDRGRGMVEGAPPPEEADALISQQPGVTLMVLAADCALILLWDPVHQAIGAAHAGWRGTIAGVAFNTLRALGQAFGTKADDIRVGIGPAIGPCCYEVDEPVLGLLRRHFPHYYGRVTHPARPGHRMLDLQETNRLQLRAAGVPESHIEVLRLCTACHTDLFYSERAQGRPSGRFGAVIALPG